MKNEAKKKYAKKCKQKVVTFYKCDEELLAFASSINFQAFVKELLYECMQQYRNGNIWIMRKWGKKHE